MQECVIIGRPNSGKTIFALQFASFVGARSVDITARSPDNLLTCRHYSVKDAKNDLCSQNLHKTRMIQSIVIKMAIGKAEVAFKLTDTCGLTETIHPEPAIRYGMAQTLGLMRTANLILHMIDLSQITADYSEQATIDHEIYYYGLTRRFYMILANKMDLPIAKEGLTRLKSIFPSAFILPISALYSHGLGEVKTYVARNV
jgi:GTPase Era involved in 16S rRNA processing